MDYIEVSISLKNEYHELLIAELFDMDFEGFEEDENLLKCSIPSNRFDDTKREEIEQILMGFGAGAIIISEDLISPQNWNQTWEQSIKPQTIGKFYVRPTWAPKNQNNNIIELLIDPKMAFGTGYHATTRLILEWIPEIISKGDIILDAGTGTGILGIAAIKVGATSAFGFDIDEWSKDNAEENMELNGIDNFDVELGSIEVIPKDAEYDVILANINRNALIYLIPQLLIFLKKGGKLLLSGLLKEDEETILSLDCVKSLEYQETRQQQEWIAILFNS